VVPFDGSRVKLRLPIIALCNLFVVVTSGGNSCVQNRQAINAHPCCQLVALVSWSSIGTIFNCDILECLY
jgi:hypothetical protein